MTAVNDSEYVHKDEEKDSHTSDGVIKAGDSGLELDAGGFISYIHNIYTNTL